MLELRVMKVDELRDKNVEIVPSSYLRLQSERVHFELELTKSFSVYGYS
jgi:hypothetical protein